MRSNECGEGLSGDTGGLVCRVMATCCASLEKPEGTGLCSGDGKGGHWWRLGLAALIAGQSMVFSLALNLDPVTGEERWMLHGMLAVAAVAVFVLVGGRLAREAWQALRQGRWVVEQFFLIGIAGAFAASVHSSITGVGSVYYEVVSVLVAIYTLGKMVGERRREQALSAVASLRREFERCVRLTCCGQEQEMPVVEVQAGDRVKVVAGGGVPVDGWVQEGTALVVETPINGEPFPKVKRPGDRVWAGSRVLDAVLVIEAEHSGRERQLDRLLADVEAARNRPSRLQREADRIVAWFLPTVLLLSVATTLGWGLAKGWTVGIFNGLAVLVVACPCAMGLATPIAVWSALNRMARRGLVPASGEFLERLAQATVVVFDKTGTLTEDQLQVVDWVTVEGVERRELEAQIAAVQHSLDHPVARAFRGFVPASAWRVEKIEPLPGRGIRAFVNGARGQVVLELGNECLGEDAGPLWRDLAGQLRAPVGSRMVAVRREGRLVAAAGLREILREQARVVVERFQGEGVRVMVMTGDRAMHAQALELRGVEIHAGMSAEEKAAAVRKLQARGEKVVFVGDGINDAPALAAADAGIALSSGAELSREASSAQLFGADLSAVVEAWEMARATVRGIRINLRVASVYNLAGISLAVAGVLNPIAAAVLMMLSSFTVSFRALGLAGTGTAPARENKPRHEAKTPALPWQNGWAAAVALALAGQGFVLAHLAALKPWAAAVTVLVFGLMGIAAWNTRAGWVRRPYRASFVSMLALGNLGMLVGWWGDAGWLPAVRDGVCLCGCQKSHFGAGLVGGMGWMHAGMLVFSLPAVWWEQRWQAAKSRLWDWRWMLCLVMMFLGMQAGAWAVMGWFKGQPQLQLLVSYAGMTLGMTAAMLVVCGPRLMAEQRRERIEQ